MVRTYPLASYCHPNYPTYAEKDMIIYTKHAVERMDTRDVLRSEVKRVLAKGKLITDHSGAHGEFKIAYAGIIVIGHVTEGDDIVIMTTWRALLCRTR